MCVKVEFLGFGYCVIVFEENDCELDLMIVFNDVVIMNNFYKIIFENGEIVFEKLNGECIIFFIILEDDVNVGDMYDYLLLVGDIVELFIFFEVKMEKLSEVECLILIGKSDFLFDCLVKEGYGDL